MAKKTVKVEAVEETGVELTPEVSEAAPAEPQVREEDLPASVRAEIAAGRAALAKVAAQ